jgi:hypothetical protein
MRKSLLLALGVALFMTGCASQQPAYGGGYAAGYYLGDCAYEDICGPGLYGQYFYYTPFYPTGPLSPERIKVDLTATRRIPRVVEPRGISRDSGSGYSAPSDSYTSTAPASAPASVPVPAPPPPAVHTVGPRN